MKTIDDLIAQTDRVIGEAEALKRWAGQALFEAQQLKRDLEEFRAEQTGKVRPDAALEELGPVRHKHPFEEIGENIARANGGVWPAALHLLMPDTGAMTADEVPADLTADELAGTADPEEAVR